MDVLLSASEEITLRRVYYAIAKPDALIARDVEHLLELALISRQEARLVLTEIGRRRDLHKVSARFRTKTRQRGAPVSNRLQSL